MSQSDIQIKRTADGSNTLYLPELNETYHSLHGALSESQHVYIANGLHVLLNKGFKDLYIFELGFGTAMNALLTIDALPNDVQCHYYSLEPFLPNIDLIKKYYQDFESLPTSIEYLEQLYANQNEWVQLNHNFKFYVDTTPLEQLEASTVLNHTDNAFHLVYFDAFAPSKQPELWSVSSLEKIQCIMDSNAILTTYCAQGQFKRNLKSLGFDVQHPRGANGKREMTIAIKK
jgi:tRNA U34 5-methylaminomethyl-2-thiouridine-forming methyltransferase MnmC